MLKHYIRDAEWSLRARNLGNDNLHLREEPSEPLFCAGKAVLSPQLPAGRFGSLMGGTEA